MAIIIKTEEEIAHLREGGKRLARILKEVATHVRPGISTLELDKIAEELIRKGGDEPAFKGYRPAHHMAPYPASLCTSINSEVVHGIPKASAILKEGDIVSLDLGLKHKNLFTDHAISVIVGKGTKKDQEFLENTHESLLVGIYEAFAGNRTGDVGAAVSEFVKPFKYGVVRDLAGHGVGRAIHEDPFIPNYGKARQDEKPQGDVQHVAVFLPKSVGQQKQGEKDARHGEMDQCQMQLSAVHGTSRKIIAILFDFRTGKNDVGQG
jgi:methionyl aminopeptidase